MSLLISMFAFFCGCFTDPTNFYNAFEFEIVEMESCWVGVKEQYTYYVKVTAVNGEPTEYYRVWYSNSQVSACSAGKLDSERQTYVYYSNASEVADLSICKLGDTRYEKYPYSK